MVNTSRWRLAGGKPSLSNIDLIIFIWGLKSAFFFPLSFFTKEMALIEFICTSSCHPEDIEEIRDIQIAPQRRLRIL